MSQSTRQEIIDAYSALDDLRDNALELEGVKAQKQYHAVLKILPPLPRPTMAEVEWDDDEHYLAEAEHPEYGKVIMLNMPPVSGEVITIFKRDGVVYSPRVLPQNLIPTGRRYTLTEVQE